MRSQARFAKPHLLSSPEQAEAESDDRVADAARARDDMDSELDRARVEPFPDLVVHLTHLEVALERCVAPAPDAHLAVARPRGARRSHRPPERRSGSGGPRSAPPSSMSRPSSGPSELVDGPHDPRVGELVVRRTRAPFPRTARFGVDRAARPAAAGSSRRSASPPRSSSRRGVGVEVERPVVQLVERPARPRVAERAAQSSAGTSAPCACGCGARRLACRRRARPRARGRTSTCGTGSPSICEGGRTGARTACRRCVPTTRSRTRAARRSTRGTRSARPRDVPRASRTGTSAGVMLATRTGPSHGPGMRTTNSSFTRQLPSRRASSERWRTRSAPRCRGPPSPSPRAPRPTGSSPRSGRCSAGGSGDRRRGHACTSSRSTDSASGGGASSGQDPSSSSRYSGVVRHM